MRRSAHILVFASLMIIFPMIVHAQLDSKPINLGKYDHDKTHFGFTLGINSSNFIVNRVGDFKIQDTIYNVESEPVSGLNLGIVSNLRIAENFDLRFIPTLSFGQRNLNYHFIFGNEETFTTKKIESTYLEFPLLLKFKSNRINNYRIYVLGGFKYAIDMVSQAKVNNKDKDIVKLNRNDYGYEVGLGFDFYLDYFKFSPEIKMYSGQKNLLVPENTRYATPMDALYAKTFVVSFLFE